MSGLIDVLRLCLEIRRKNPSYKLMVTKWYKDMYTINHLQSDMLSHVNGNVGFSMTEMYWSILQTSPRKMTALGWGVWTWPQKTPSFSLRQYTMVFQTDIFDIKAYGIETTDRGSKNKNMCFLWDSEATVTATDTLSTPNLYGIAINLPWNLLT